VNSWINIQHHSPGGTYQTQNNTGSGAVGDHAGAGVHTGSGAHRAADTSALALPDETIVTPRRIRILVASINRHNGHGKHVDPHKLHTHTPIHTHGPTGTRLIGVYPDLQYISHSRKADGMPYNGNLNNGHGHIIGRLRVDLLKLMLVQQHQHLHTVHNAPDRELNNWSRTWRYGGAGHN
jgi:hypothetical protein